MIDDFKALNADICEDDQLERFFNVLKSFNKGNKINQEIIEKITVFMHYKWECDKNQAIDEPDELAILDQLPKET